MTKEDLEQIIHNIDLLEHPFALFVHPSQEAQIRDTLRDMCVLDRFVINVTQAVEEGKIIVVKRKELEEWSMPRIDFPFDEN